MGFQTVPGTTTQYGLLSFDSDGKERPEGGKLFSDTLLQQAPGHTNIFFFCHGWKGDIPEAVRQYDLWIKALLDSADMAQAKQVFPNFKPMFIGLHWPSQPWGDEEMGGAGGSFAAAGAVGADALLNMYLKRLGDRPEVREPLKVIIDAARSNASPQKLPKNVADAYKDLCKALGICPDGGGTTPDTDNQKFEPEEIYEIAQDEGSDFGGFSLGGLLSPLRQLSYWTMKKRARAVGEGGMHDFLKKLQQAAPAARIHLMGHSFGTIVISSMLGGPSGQGQLPRPIDSVALIQGAVSLWSYAAAIPFANAGSGYFSKVLTGNKVKGPIVITQSKHDRAVGAFYPLASQVSGSAAFPAGVFPELGAMGAFGLQGLKTLQHDLKMLPATGSYQFAPGKVYNLESTTYIAKGEGASGAHSDIAGPEVAHAIWSAAFASV